MTKFPERKTIAGVRCHAVTNDLPLDDIDFANTVISECISAGRDAYIDISGDWCVVYATEVVRPDNGASVGINARRVIERDGMKLENMTKRLPPTMTNRKYCERVAAQIRKGRPAFVIDQGGEIAVYAEPVETLQTELESGKKVRGAPDGWEMPDQQKVGTFGPLGSNGMGGTWTRTT